MHPTTDILTLDFLSMYNFNEPPNMPRRLGEEGYLHTVGERRKYIDELPQLTINWLNHLLFQMKLRRSNSFTFAILARSVKEEPVPDNPKRRIVICDVDEAML